MSDPEQWSRIWEIFEQAAPLSQDQREPFLGQACSDDEELRRAVEELLAADAEGDAFFDHPVLDRDSTVTRGQPGAEPSVPMPESIGPYRLLRQVGEGGMSTVYLAVRDDDEVRRRVVVKVVRRGMESPSGLRRLRTERQILASLEHPNIARLYDGGSTASGMPYFVLEYIDGLPIDTWCEHSQLTVEQRVELFRKVCAAVGYAHQNLVVHRDLKPSNILVTSGGEPKLLDFGIAKLLNPDLAAPELEPTATWHRAMTPSYASPEQVRGKLITTSTDVYSLGVLLYKLLTGRLPFRFTNRSPAEIERILTDQLPPKPSEAVSGEVDDEGSTTTIKTSGSETETRPEVLRRQLSGDLDAIVMKALRSAPQLRYGSVEQLAADLERFQLGLPVAARQGSWGYRLGKLVRRHRGKVAAGVVAALLLAGFAGAMVWQSARVTAERDQARIERDAKQQVLTLLLDLVELGNPYVEPEAELSVREAVERSLPLVLSQLDQQPDLRSQLLQLTGTLLAKLGQYDRARPQLEEALGLAREIHGERHLQVATIESALAEVLKEQGELDQAEALAREALASARQLATGDRRWLVGPLEELVSVLCFKGQWAAAEAPAREALRLTAELPEDGQRIRALEQLAIIEANRGQYGAASALYWQALALRHSLFGEDHPGKINTLNNLGMSLRREGELQPAMDVYQEAETLLVRLFGNQHRKLATLTNNLAGLHGEMGDWGRAEAAYRRAGEIQHSIAPDHWRNFFLGLRVAQAQMSAGRPTAAETEIRSLLADWRARLGEHWILAEADSLLGAAVSHQGRCEEAEPLLIAGFEGFLERDGERQRQDAFERLRDHFERCGRVAEVAPFRDRLEQAGLP